MKIRLADPETLKPYPHNPRLISQAAIDKVLASVREFGWRQPIVVDEDGVILVGHTRRLAAIKGGYKQVPVHDATGLSDAQKRAYRLADNRTGEESEWDMPVLGAEIASLRLDGFDLAPLGFDLPELRGLEAKEPGKDAEATPEPPKNPVTKLGDLWELGDHRLHCGDATKAESVAALMRGETATATFTDPPYGIGFNYDDHKDTADGNGALVAAAFELCPKAKVWTPGGMNLPRDISRFGRARVLYWHKGFAAAGNGVGGASTVEPVLVLAPARKKLPDDYLPFKVDRASVGGKNLGDLHPCPKPVALFEHLLRCLSGEGAIIYEPFCGSGTTLIAAEITGRRCYAMEISPNYCDVIIRRWEEFTGKKAKLAATGDSFEQTAKRRKVKTK